MRAVLILIFAMVVGLAGGYAWSVTLHTKKPVHVPKAAKTAAFVIPRSTADEDWQARADHKKALGERGDAPSAQNHVLVESSLSYAKCIEAHRDGNAPIHRSGLDGDGVACEPYPS